MPYKQLPSGLHISIRGLCSDRQLPVGYLPPLLLLETVPAHLGNKPDPLLDAPLPPSHLARRHWVLIVVTTATTLPNLDSPEWIVSGHRNVG